MNRAEFLVSWRRDIGLDARRVAERAGLNEATLASIEAGAREPSLDELEALSRVLGLRSEDLYEEPIAAAGANDAVRMLLKSAETFAPGPDVRLRMIEAARAALDLMDLLAVSHPGEKSGYQKLKAKPKTAQTKPLHAQGAELAREVRRELAIQGPVASMRDLVVDTLGIPVVAADLHLNGPDAFTVYAPSRRPAIVVNISGKNENGLVRRFSLAHELGHALFDRPSVGAFGVACQWDPNRHLDRETRANAFAMRLLLPESEIRKLEDGVLVPAEFRRVMVQWGVHCSALQLYVTKLRDMSDAEAKRDLPQVDTTCPLRWQDEEELPAERTGLGEVPLPRRGRLLEELLLAYQQRRLGLGAVRDALHVDPLVSIAQLASVLDLPAIEA